MDRIDAMRTFVTVVSEGSFTRAADRLGMSPQLTSKYVSRLEQHLGVRLLNRTTRKLHLTEAGASYHLRAQQVLSDIEDMEHQIGNLQTQARGVLRISAPVSFAIRHLPPLLQAFQTAHPAVGVDLQLNDRKVDLVDEGFDIALRIGQLKSSSLIAKRLAPVRLALCASPAYLRQHGTPQHPEDLGHHRYLHYSYMELDTSQTLHRWLQTAAQNGNHGMVSNNGDVLFEAALAGAGIVLQPTFISGAAIKAGKLQVLLTDYEPEPIGLYAVYAHRQLLASKVRSFIDFVDGYFGDPPYWD
ncbi:LysR family transcriptional regulator [Marinobacter sp. X15-166B]|uniref:LysR family transcriptional regulator n=1 Tax=Marinobacter sp. X15-166B TaxID=1897620 RepID=UPI00085CD3B8|nr:LysR family transcriptional regulator [Marinobacter sp. X15-166B]OEY65103.1 LysR family transcriptional regulator [Marinobacter sp. X15-166B]